METTNGYDVIIRKTSGFKRLSSGSDDTLSALHGNHGYHVGRGNSVGILVRIFVAACVVTVLLAVCFTVVCLVDVRRELVQLRQDLRNTKERLRFGDGRDSSGLREELTVDASRRISHPHSHDRSQLRVRVDGKADETIQERQESSERRQRRDLENDDNTHPPPLESAEEVKPLRDEEPRRDKKKRNKDTKHKSVGQVNSQKQRKDVSRSLPKAAHFYANSTERSLKTSTNPPAFSFWQDAMWPNAANQSFYHLNNGIVTILEDGLYFIYAQLSFHDLSGRWSFSVNINGRQEMKCINSEHISSATTFHPTNHGVYQHCFSSRLFHIQRMEQVTIGCLYGQRNLMLSPEFTFWGIIRMS